jgi:hypothetical protein
MCYVACQGTIPSFGKQRLATILYHQGIIISPNTVHCIVRKHAPPAPAVTYSLRRHIVTTRKVQTGGLVKFRQQRRQFDLPKDTYEVVLREGQDYLFCLGDQVVIRNGKGQAASNNSAR